MKVVKVTLFAMLAALVAVGVSTTAYSFHSGGVGECGGCHSMHSSPAGATFLLVGTDQSSACLTCHQKAGDTGPSSYHISTAEGDMPAGSAPKHLTPGGDFGWLKKTYNFVLRSTPTTEEGATHGHNIIAADKGYVVDPTNTTAPGGTFPSAQLACNSCHDPHGQYRRITTAGAVVKTGAPIKASGSYNDPLINEPDATGAVGVYRLLAGAGYTKSGASFNGVPAAKVPSSYNRSEATSQTRVAYGSATTNGHVAWGTWCSTCHPDMHGRTGFLVHPQDQALGSTIAANYVSYKKTGDLTGVLLGSFSSLVPFASDTVDYTVLASTASTAATTNGPGATDQVMCLSCHRAHASGFEYMLRWEGEYEFLTKADSTGVATYGGTDSTLPTDNTLHRGRTAAEKLVSYYNRPANTFATYQRSLCNKCHVKD